MHPSEVCAIIPARGGSKGIPRKNIRLLAGKPLVAYSIEAALQTPAIGRVLVSTDDPEIAEVARAYGADIIWRPAELSSDTASSESALMHALDHLKETEGYQPELVVFLQATSPLRQPYDLHHAIELFESKQADSLFSGSPVHGFVWRTDGTNVAPINYEPTKRPRRQDMAETIIEENGSFYMFKPEVLRAHNSRLGGSIAVYQMSPLDSYQIDEPNDFPFLERLLGLQKASHSTAALAHVQLLVLDFDGVMTDNRVLVSETGEEAVWCHRGDGWGIARLKEAGVEVVVLSTEKNPVVAQRCRKLGIDCIQGSDHKLDALQHMAQARSLSRDQIAYVGNDVNDLECLQWVGMPIVVADAVPAVAHVAQMQTTHAGGYGAVREVADWIIGARIAFYSL